MTVKIESPQKKPLPTKDKKSTEDNLSILKEILGVWRELLGIIGLMLGLVWQDRRQKMSDVRQPSHTPKSSVKKINIFNMPSKKIKKNIQYFFRELGEKLDIKPEFLIHLFNVQSADDEITITKCCEVFRAYLNGNPNHNVHSFIIDMAVKTIKDKCKNDNRNVADVSFQCLSAFYDNCTCDDKEEINTVFLNCFSELLNSPELKKHVKFFATAELFNFCNKTNFEYDHIHQCIDLIKNIFNYLIMIENWNNDDKIIFETCMHGIGQFKNTDEAVDTLLPLATDLTEKYMDLLLTPYAKAICNLEINMNHNEEIKKIENRIRVWLEKEKEKESESESEMEKNNGFFVTFSIAITDWLRNKESSNIQRNKRIKEISNILEHSIVRCKRSVSRKKVIIEKHTHAHLVNFSKSGMLIDVDGKLEKTNGNYTLKTNSGNINIPPTFKVDILDADGRSICVTEKVKVVDWERDKGSLNGKAKIPVEFISRNFDTSLIFSS